MRATLNETGWGGVKLNLRPKGYRMAPWLMKNSTWYIVVLLITIVMLFPLFWMITIALKSNNDIFHIPPVSATTYSDNAQSAFASGQVPMLLQGQWLASSFLSANPKFQYGFAPLPVVNKVVQPYDAVGLSSPSTI